MALLLQYNLSYELSPPPERNLLPFFLHPQLHSVRSFDRTIQFLRATAHARTLYYHSRIKFSNGCNARYCNAEISGRESGGIANAAGITI